MRNEFPTLRFMKFNPLYLLILFSNIAFAHNDPTGHQLELDVLQKLYQINGKKQALSMEMFEKDIQQVMNEYLQNLIREKNFIKEARAWNKYTDYKPIIEFTKEKDLLLIYFVVLINP